MFQEAPCTGADRRELRCSHEARYKPNSITLASSELATVMEFGREPASS